MCIRDSPMAALALASMAVVLLLSYASEPPGGTTTLSHGGEMPLVGLGVGNMPHKHIPHMVHRSVQELGIRLIDTAMASKNEGMVAAAANAALHPQPQPVHVITKVWYTHLGFNRTMLAVRGALRRLRPKPLNPNPGPGPDPLKIAVLIHWPHCRCLLYTSPSPRDS
eukprot:TRINITY_DN61843_c0_g1_i1.p1 TRINITY_DN61843_c0_g1~~TRINITY_DN61843_c0_g1_i1.p1  ORF type:complete len:195 (-),score=39.02 TRINITY_DN61843_c0_g1_i1:144-644(-)